MSDHSFNVHAFILTALLINIVPGPAMLFVLGQSHYSNLKNGIFAALGVELGVFIYVVFAALGLGVFIESFPSLYLGLQCMGALYLLYLAYQLWPGEKNSTNQEKRKNFRNPFLKGLLINLTNPKILLFFVTLLPQFISPNAKNVTFIFLLLGCIFNFGGIVVNLGVAIFSSSLAGYINRNVWLNYVPSILFIMIATNFALQTIRDI